jgi:tRNA-(ms[2]io[6]A)-hydroxylase
VSHSQLLEPIHDFLLCKTPTQWVDKAIKKENLSVILIDHLICEQKYIMSKQQI